MHTAPDNKKAPPFGALFCMRAIWELYPTGCPVNILSPTRTMTRPSGSVFSRNPCTETQLPKMIVFNMPVNPNVNDVKVI